MRQQYTCIFKRTLSSRVWVLPTAHRCVWLWLKLAADPEGFVCADVAGVAYGAHVTGPEARDALEVLAMADADADPEDPHEGRIIERVRGGWRVLGCEQDRELAKLEGKRARTRQYMRNARSRAANDVTTEGHSDPETVTVTPPKPTPITKPNAVEDNSGSPLPPKGSVVVAPPSHIEVSKGLFVSRETLEQSLLEPKAPPSRDVAPQSTDTLPGVLRRIPDDWSPSEALRAAAAMAGVTDFDARIDSLRTGTIGGNRGVLIDQLEKYISGFFGKWKTWAETDRAKARAAAAAPPSSKRQFIAPTPEPKAKHLRIAKSWGIDLEAIKAELLERKVVETLGTDRYLEMLEQELAKRCKAKRDAGYRAA